MRGDVEFTLPEAVRIAGIRGALGVGLGLLLAAGLSEEKRRLIGWTLFLAGAYAAATEGWEIFGRPRSLRLEFGSQQGDGRSEAMDRLGQPTGFTRT